MYLAALSKRLRAKVSQRRRFHNNKMHKHKVKALYAAFRYGDSGGVTTPPTAESVKEYWGGLFGDKVNHNRDAPWIRDERREMVGKSKAVWVDVDVNTLQSTTARLANWKSPGVDQVQNFWLKKLTALHPLMAKLCNTVAREPSTAPSWLTCGRTTLIYKKGPTDVATNYRPITCLPTIYKLMTLPIHSHYPPTFHCFALIR